MSALPTLGSMRERTEAAREAQDREYQKNKRNVRALVVDAMVDAAHRGEWHARVLIAPSLHRHGEEMVGELLRAGYSAGLTASGMRDGGSRFLNVGWSRADRQPGED